MLGKINYQRLKIVEDIAKTRELSAARASQQLALNSPTAQRCSQKRLFEPPPAVRPEKPRPKLFYLDDGVLRFKSSSPRRGRKCESIRVPHYTAAELKERRQGEK